MKINPAATRNLVSAVLAGEECVDSEITVVFVDDKNMIDLNTRYLDHHYTTDVISFNLSGEDERTVEGEVYVNVAQAKRQAREYRVSVMNEIGRLVVHGVLHLLGYEDDTRSKKTLMHKCENHYLGKHGMEYFHA